MLSFRNLFAAGALAVVAAFVLWNSPSLFGVFLGIGEFFARNAEKYPAQAVSVFIALAAVSAMIAPLSSVPLVPFVLPVWGNELTLTFLMVGWMIGGALTYVIGRLAAYPFLRKLALYDKVLYYRRRLAARSQFWLVLLFRLAMPAELPGYVLGGLRYDFGKYMFATFVTELPVGLVTIYATNAFLGQERLLFVGLVILTLGAIALFYRSFQLAIRNVRAPVD